MRTHISWLVLLCSLTWLGPRALALPAEVILLRHGEKPPDPDDVHLSPVGEERARMLARYIATTPALTNSGVPSVLFATGWTRRSHSRRPFETLEPLAKQLHQPIRRPFLVEDYARLARQILTSPECDGKVVVVCWVHEFLPDLARALGVTPKPPPWKGHIYDRVWKITWVDHRAQLRELRQPPLPHAVPVSG
jgi:hypothetical protein